MVAEKIRRNLAMPYVLGPGGVAADGGSIEHTCTASIGVVVFQGPQVTQAELVAAADEAMYAAKQVGGNSVRFHYVGTTAAGMGAGTRAPDGGIHPDPSRAGRPR